VTKQSCITPPSKFPETDLRTIISSIFSKVTFILILSINQLKEGRSTATFIAGTVISADMENQGFRCIEGLGVSTERA
jgi:hypothetical protein